MTSPETRCILPAPSNLDERDLSTIDPELARSLLDLAREARRNAYAPYSEFPVGAALLASDGRIFTGVNVENVSYGLANCAERVAIFRAVTEGAREFDAIAVVGPEDDVSCSPCGACRQVMHEFAPDMILVTPDGDGFHADRVRDLLPGAFVPARLAGYGRTV